MMGFLTTLVLAGTALIIVFFLGVIVLTGIRHFRSGQEGRISPEESDEARMIQEIYQSLEKLDARVDNLESILMRQNEEGGPK
jgi:phage shock protein B